jgi:uncharacterized protein YjbI with pentapeptide repeats
MTAEWSPCGQGGCTAFPAPEAERCWQHLPPLALPATLARLAPGADVDLRGTRVDGELLGQILARLRNAAGTLVIGKLSCEDAYFTHVAEFKKIAIEGDAIFSGCTFDADVLFEVAVFTENAVFDDGAFRGTATFTDAEFRRGASFKRRQFSSAVFRDAKFAGPVTFEEARVSAALELAPVRGFATLTLTGLAVSADLDVRANVPEVRCERAEFGGRTRLHLAGAKLSLNNSSFTQPAIVESWRDPAQGTASVAADDLLVRICSLQGVDAEHLTLSGADLRQCLISGIYRPEELRLAGHCQFAPTPSGWHLRWKCVPWRWTRREALYEEHLWRGWAASVPGQIGSGTTREARRSDAARLAVLYRQLRKGLEEARNEPGAADLYYGEMEMRRFSTKGWDERLLLSAYWLVSGYGLRASRSMLVLACLILTAAEAFERVGFGHHKHDPGYVDCLLYTAGSLLSLDLSGHLPAVLSDWGQVFRMTLRVMGPVLLGLGALAIRGRVKRSSG